MRIQVGDKLINIRETMGKLWYPRKNTAVMRKMDELYERTSPNELMWDSTKPKVDDIEKRINPREVTDPVEVGVQGELEFDEVELNFEDKD